MLDKIVLSQDRRSATVHFDTHSFNFYHSEGFVMLLVYEILLEPSKRIEDRYKAAEEDTVEIELQLSFKEVA